MSKKKKLRIFISYSREDESLIKPIVEVLRIAESKVFLDIDSIAPGKLWEKKLKTTLDRTDKVCVFWCCHSARSEWVKREWQYALRREKIIVPILLDKTPLAINLAKYQHIDLSDHGGHRSFHPNMYGIYNPEKPQPGGNWMSFLLSPPSANQIAEMIVAFIEKDSI